MEPCCVSSSGLCRVLSAASGQAQLLPRAWGEQGLTAQGHRLWLGCDPGKLTCWKLIPTLVCEQLARRWHLEQGVFGRRLGLGGLRGLGHDGASGFAQRRRDPSWTHALPHHGRPPPVELLQQALAGCRHLALALARPQSCGPDELLLCPICPCGGLDWTWLLHSAGLHTPVIS